VAASTQGPRHRWLVAGSAAAIVVLLAVALLFWRPWRSPTASDTSAPSTSSPVSASTASSPTAPPPAVAPAPPAESPPSTTTTPAISRVGFYGEWGQHSTSVTLAPDGSAHYAVWSGVANGTSWSATWSPMTSTTAMIVLATRLESHGDTTCQRLDRYSGEALHLHVATRWLCDDHEPHGSSGHLVPQRYRVS
jgi:serine/threonine-protein kinase